MDCGINLFDIWVNSIEVAWLLALSVATGVFGTLLWRRVKQRAPGAERDRPSVPPQP